MLAVGEDGENADATIVAEDEEVEIAGAAFRALIDDR